MPKTIVCKICGQSGLTFRPVSGGGYFMFDANGVRHDKCKPGSYSASNDTPDKSDAGEPGNDPPITAPAQQGQPANQPKPDPAVSAETVAGKCHQKIKVDTDQSNGEDQADGPSAEPEDLYIPPTIEIDGPQHENSGKAIYWLVRRRKPVALFGESGSMKSTFAQQLANLLFPKAIRPDGTNARFYPMSFNSMTSKGDIKGMVDAMGVFHPSPFYYAYKFGGLFLADEFDAGNDNTNLLFNMAFSNGCMTFANGETVKQHAKCFCIAGTNTTGNGADRVFTGRNEIDAATKDRFKWIIWDVNPHLELLIAGVDQVRWVSYIQEARRVRKMLGITSNLLTPRASIDGAAALRDGQSWRDTHDVLVRATLTDDEWSQIESNMDQKIRSYNG